MGFYEERKCGEGAEKRVRYSVLCVFKFLTSHVQDTMDWCRSATRQANSSNVNLTDRGVAPCPDNLHNIRFQVTHYFTQS